MAWRAFFLVAILATSAYAQGHDGDLDFSFGNGDEVTTDVLWRDHAPTLAVQPDGRIILAGTVQVPFTMGQRQPPTDICLIRYNTDGSVDRSFGESGIVVTNITEEGYEEISNVSVQWDGKIVAVGRIYAVGTHHVVLVRYDTNGFLDETFGPSGKIIFEPFYDRAKDYAYLPGGLVVQSDGKVVSAGVASYSEDHFTDRTTGLLSLERYNTDGSFDETFGVSGRVRTDVSSDADWPGSLAIQPDGKIVAAVTIGAMTTKSDFAVARYNKDGSLDTAFGSSGIVALDLSGSDDWVTGIQLLPDGKILASGFAKYDLALVRYNHDGSLDATFGTSGIVISDLLGIREQAPSIALQSDGKILVSGTANAGPPLWSAAPSFVARYTRSGELDRTFGTDGYVRITPFLGRPTIRIQSDGKIIIAGTTGALPPPTDFVILRLLNSDVPGMIGVRIDPDNVAVGRSWTDTFSGSNLNDETYFDIRFIPPNSNNKLL